MDDATLQGLIAQGRQMSEEDFCALALQERDS
jgi:hypothetical protein